MKKAIILNETAYKFFVQSIAWRSAWQVAARPSYKTHPVVLHTFRALMRDYAKFAINSARSSK